MRLVTALVLFGLWINDTALSFSLGPLHSKQARSCAQTALFQQNGGGGYLEMDRRSAMVAAAALTLTLPQVEPANALGILGPLQFTCYSLLQENKETVNSIGDPTKQIPVITLEPDPKTKGYGRILTVSVPHVMDPEKPPFVGYMWLLDVTKGGKGVGNVIVAKEFKADRPSDMASPPSIEAKVASGYSATKYAQITKGTTVKPYIYCDLYGLWEGEAVAL